MTMTLSEMYSALQEGTGQVPPDVANAIRVAASQSPVAFSSFLASVALDDRCALFDVYESLIEEPAVHAACLLAELERLLAAAHTSPRNRAIYSQLDAYAMIKGPESLQRAIAGVLRGALRSPAPQVRRFAAFLAGDFISPDSSDLAEHLRQVQTNDRDWRVRLMAHASLRDLHTQHPAVPPPLALSFGDRVLAKVFPKQSREFAA